MNPREQYIQDLELIAACAALGVMTPEEQAGINPLRVIAVLKMVEENETRINQSTHAAMKRLGLFKN
jgi:hypothetical protein